VLERHLKQSEVIYPKQEIGTFRGESVYSRLNVLPLKSSETWTRLGRRVKEGCQPLKLVKQRAITINRKRAVELARAEGEESMQGLYAEEQTELYVPEPVINVGLFLDFSSIEIRSYLSTNRVLFPRMTSGTLISTLRPCYLRVPHIYHVRLSDLGVSLG
jgi:hypothetical protein